MDSPCKKVIVRLLVCALLGACHSAPAGDNEDPFALSFIHFSDFHARYLPISPNNGLCYEHEREKCIGGIARVSTIARRLRETRPNPIFLYAGDSFQGTLYFDVHRGNMTSYFMKKLPYDAVTIGNHDFDDDLPGLKSFVKSMPVPTLVTNIDCTDEPSMQNLFLNSTIIEKGGKNVGIIGVISSQTNKMTTKTGKLKFLDEISTINSEARKLRSKGVNIIVVLSHCGIEEDQTIAKNCPDVDVVVGGHSHLLLYNGTAPSNDFVYGTYPLVVNQSEGNRKVLVIHSGPYTKYMGDIQIFFNKEDEVVGWKGNPIYLDATVREDPDIVQELKPWKAEVDKIGKELIGETKIFLNGRCSRGDCNMAHLVTDAMLDYFAGEATISLIAAHFIQNSIPEGPITYEDIYMTLPFNQTWHLIEMTGRDLLQILEDNIPRGTRKDSLNVPKMLHWAGLRVTYDLGQGHRRVASASVRRGRFFEVLDEKSSYRIAAPTFLLGRHGIRGKHAPLLTGQAGEVDSLRSYIRRLGVIGPVREDVRILFL